MAEVCQRCKRVEEQVCRAFTRRFPYRAYVDVESALSQLLRADLEEPGSEHASGPVPPPEQQQAVPTQQEPAEAEEKSEA